MSNLAPLMKRNFLEYASYTILDRALPDLRDGCKPVQRRLLHTLWEMDDGLFHKVANVIGETMKLHPHGDASIGDALVVLANKDYFVDRQGNFGNPITGHEAAAARYIECRLTELARETLFNPNLTEYSPSYDGRRLEPVFLPAKLPVVLMLGVEGIAVGMATRILPHNFVELLRGQIAILQGERYRIYPDFQSGGLMDVSEYDKGRGKVKVRARIEARGEKIIAIREIPFGTTTESLIASIESAVQKGRVKISGIEDFTTDKVEIELSLARGVYAEEVIPQLYAYTDCEVTLQSSLLVIRDQKPVELTVHEVLEDATERLKKQIKAELDWEERQLVDRQHWMTLERIFIENRVYKKIETAKTQEKVHEAVVSGMAEFKRQFVRPMIDDDVAKLLEIRIRRISAYDIERHKEELAEVETQLDTVRKKLKQLTKTVIAWLEGLIEKYGERYKRRTKVGAIEEVDKKAVASANVKLSYDDESGFFGSDVRGSEFQLQVTEYDRVLAVSSDGTYRIMAAPKKVLLPRKVLWVGVFDPEKGQDFTLVYRDGQRNAFGKRVHIESFIHDKEYRFFKDEKGRLDLLLPGDAPPGKVHLAFVAQKRQRQKEAEFDLGELEFAGIHARGQRLAPKPVARVKHLED
ncbi:MAG TPA: DNA topoisomerase IV subunit A [Myxococcota bacterium]|nr:DNA topoisomerase IV subunit A [Myxococcota bacterium]